MMLKLSVLLSVKKSSFAAQTELVSVCLNLKVWFSQSLWYNRQDMNSIRWSLSPPQSLLMYPDPFYYPPLLCCKSIH